MAEQLHETEAESAERGGSFLFEPVGHRAFMTPEKFTGTQREFYRTGHNFAEKEVSPRGADIEKKNNELLRELLLKAGELGLNGVDIPEQFGGLGLDKTTSMLVGESQAYDSASWSATFGAHTGIGTLPIVFFGTEAQKAKYLPALATGEKVAAYALSEAGSGSDALGAKTVAKLSEDGKHYVVNGGKMWITNGGFADVYVVFLQCQPGGFTALIVERGTPGFSVGREEHKLGIRGSSTTPLIFEDAKVPVENVLGQIGKGHKIAFNILNVGRLKLAAFAIGGVKSALEAGTRYALERRQFQKSISEFALIREKIATAAAQCYALEAMTYRASGAIDDAIGSETEPVKVMAAIEEFAIEASIMKVAGSEFLFQIVDEMLQVHGGNGFVEDYRIERAYRDNRVNRIFEGTNEINRMLIPGMIFKRAMKGEIPLMQAVGQLDEPLLEFAGRLANERRGVELAKRQFIFAAQTAAMLGPAIEERQEVLAALADVAIEVYAMDSMLGRTLAADDHAPLRDALCQLYCAKARERAYVRAREAVCAVAGEAEVGDAIAQLGKHYEFIPVNQAAVREQIAPAVLEAGRYPLSY